MIKTKKKINNCADLSAQIRWKIFIYLGRMWIADVIVTQILQEWKHNIH